MPARNGSPEGAPCWIDLMSSDTDRSRAFYGELFGWTSEQGGPEYGGYINFFKDGKQVAGLMAITPEMEGAVDAWSIYLSVTDLDATARDVEENGGSVVVPPMDILELGRMGVFTDAGGAFIGAWQPKEFPSFELVHEVGTPGWFELHTRDFSSTITFYDRVFSWPVTMQGDTDEFRYATYGAGEDQEAGIMDAAAWLPEGVPAHWAIYFKVEDTDAAVAKTQELGGAVVQPAEDTPYGRLASCTDPNGALFKLMS
jgi:predicted enzyme related to lactoylglutathione lyase